MRCPGIRFRTSAAHGPAPGVGRTRFHLTHIPAGYLCHGNFPDRTATHDCHRPSAPGSHRHDCNRFWVGMPLCRKGTPSRTQGTPSSAPKPNAPAWDACATMRSIISRPFIFVTIYIYRTYLTHFHISASYYFRYKLYRHPHRKPCAQSTRLCFFISTDLPHST